MPVNKLKKRMSLMRAARDAKRNSIQEPTSTASSSSTPLGSSGSGGLSTGVSSSAPTGPSQDLVLE